MKKIHPAFPFKSDRLEFLRNEFLIDQVIPSHPFLVNLSRFLHVVISRLMSTIWVLTTAWCELQVTKNAAWCWNMAETCGRKLRTKSMAWCKARASEDVPLFQRVSFCLEQPCFDGSKWFCWKNNWTYCTVSSGIPMCNMCHSQPTIWEKTP